MYACWEYRYCGENRREIVEMLIKGGANVNCKDRFSTSILALACKDGTREIIELLIKNHN